MKKTTKTAASKKLAKIAISKTRTDYQFVKNFLASEQTGKGSSIRPCYTSGQGRFTSNMNHTESTQELFKKIGIDMILTNDSPRGGLTGNLLTCITYIK